MAIYAISDLHLSHNSNKPMDVFGDQWNDYVNRLKNNWSKKICASDTVLIPGDISWAINLEEAYEDFVFIDKLPGHKIILKGNHDYWWGTASKIKKCFKEFDIDSIQILHNNSYMTEKNVICGTRGWILPDAAEFSLHDRKIYDREKQRLIFSIQSSKELEGRTIIMIHYPPFNKAGVSNELTDIIKSSGAELCIFGHVHAANKNDGYNCSIDGVDYILVSCDHLNFDPLKISL